MFKCFVLSLSLVLLVWQVCCDEPADSQPEVNADDFGLQDFNETENYFVPQPRLLQVRYNEKSYTLNFMPVNWHTARELCTEQNQVLASVKNVQENAGILLALMRYGISFSDTPFWIGGSQLGHVGRWSWVSTGLPFTYTNWIKTPSADGYCEKHCVEIFNNGKWNNNDCNLKRPVICEERPEC